MGKKRKNTPDNLPPRVYAHRTRYLHEEKGTRKITMLCSLDAPIENVWRSYQALVLDANEPGLSTFWNLAQMWMADTKSEAKRTRKKIADATAVYRRRRVEIVDIHAVEDRGGGPPRPDSRQFLVQERD